MDANLLGTIAGRLVHGGPLESGEVCDMATMVSPNLAVTSLEAIFYADDSSYGYQKELWLDFPLVPELGRFEVFLGGSDHLLDFAVLKLEKPVEIPTQPFLSANSDVTGKQWESLYFDPGRVQAFGSVADVSFPRYDERLVLEVSNPQSPRNAIGGAPILVDGKVIAITSKMIAPQASASKKTNWLAIPVSAMVRSKSTDAIRRLLEQQKASASAASNSDAGAKGFADDPLKVSLKRLEDPYNVVRMAAVETLGSIVGGNVAARAAVLERLVKDDNVDVRRAAASTLSDLASHDAEVRAALVNRLQDENSGVRRAAVRALRGATSDPQVEAALKARLEDENDEVRTLAAAVLTAAREASRAEEAKASASVSDDQDIEGVKTVSEEKVTSQETSEYADLYLKSFFRRLSPSSRRALAAAELVNTQLTIGRIVSDVFQEMGVTQIEGAPVQQPSQTESVHPEQKPAALPLHCLLAGLFENEAGPTRIIFRNKNIDDARFSALFNQATNLSLPPMAEHSPGDLEELPSLDPSTSHALQVARDTADATEAITIRTRHLLYGALSVKENPLVALLRAAGVSQEDVPLVEPSLAAVASTIAFVNADTSGGKDLLDFESDVSALSAIIAAKDIEPPLSIGLFGDWGSGKSFFMGKMDEHIRKLKDIARASDGKSSYCSNIVQIWFNAWSYVEADLWASLVTAAGVDLQGVHDWSARVGRGPGGGGTPELIKLARESSPIASVDKWKSPVLLIHGDDDHNAAFSQTVDLVRKLREHKVEFEELIFPDEVHDFLRHQDWLRAYHVASDFFDGHLKGPGEADAK